MMWIQVLKSKLHQARVTGSNPEYEGSITVDQDLMDAARIQPGEKVLIANLENGARCETYMLAGRRGSREVCLNGGAAFYGRVGDRVLLMSFVLLEAEDAKTFQPSVVRLNERNEVLTPVPT